jgi:formate dehydrogenase subunit delta
MSATTIPAHVRLANDIAVQFHGRDPEQAASEIAAHMRTFWEPRMKTALLAHVDGGAAYLDGLAVRAAELLRP